MLLFNIQLWVLLQLHLSSEQETKKSRFSCLEFYLDRSVLVSNHFLCRTSSWTSCLAPLRGCLILRKANLQPMAHESWSWCWSSSNLQSRNTQEGGNKYVSLSLIMGHIMIFWMVGVFVGLIINSSIMTLKKSMET